MTVGEWVLVFVALVIVGSVVVAFWDDEEEYHGDN